MTHTMMLAGQHSRRRARHPDTLNSKISCSNLCDDYLTCLTQDLVNPASMSFSTPQLFARLYRHPDTLICMVSAVITPLLMHNTYTGMDVP